MTVKKLQRVKDFSKCKLTITVNDVKKIHKQNYFSFEYNNFLLLIITITYAQKKSLKINFTFNF